MKKRSICRLCLALCGILVFLLTAGCRTSGKNGTGTQGHPGTNAAVTGSDTSEQGENGEPSVLWIARDGVVNYRVVYPTQGGSMCSEFAKSIAETVRNQVGASPRVQKESVAQLAEYQPAIYVGMTEALCQTDLADGLGYGDYRVCTDGVNLYVAAYSYDGLSAAVAHLNRRLRNGLDGNSIALRGFEKEGSGSDDLNDIPFYETEKTVWCYEVGADRSYEVVVADAEPADFDAYTAQLARLSYTESARRSTEAGMFASFSNGSQALYVNLVQSELRILSEPLEQAFLPASGKQSFESVCNTTGYLMGVYGGGAYENGMSMFWLLSDGSFLLFDGGHNEADADQLFQTLSGAAKENGLTEIRISAWILTHCHTDHVGMFPSFLRKYGSRVKLELLMLNRTSTQQGSAAGEGADAEQTVVRSVELYSPQTRVVRLQTGQEFWLADVRMEVLYTHSDLRQGSLSNYNDASSVIRMEISGKTVLMCGDAATAVWNLLVKRYGARLKSDYLQVPHHGAAPGGTVEAYNLILPDYLLWPAGETLYRALLDTVNPQICRHLIGLVRADRIYLAGVLGKVTAIPFA